MIVRWLEGMKFCFDFKLENKVLCCWSRHFNPVTNDGYKIWTKMTAVEWSHVTIPDTRINTSKPMQISIHEKSLKILQYFYTISHFFLIKMMVTWVMNFNWNLIVFQISIWRHNSCLNRMENFSFKTMTTFGLTSRKNDLEKSNTMVVLWVLCPSVKRGERIWLVLNMKMAR